MFEIGGGRTVELPFLPTGRELTITIFCFPFSIFLRVPHVGKHTSTRFTSTSSYAEAGTNNYFPIQELIRKNKR
jgi:hypothetical protein